MTAIPEHVEQADAEKAMDVVVGYLMEMRREKEYARDADGDYFDEKWNYTGQPSPATFTARNWARVMLDAADVDGHYGCKLCES